MPAERWLSGGVRRWRRRCFIGEPGEWGKGWYGTDAVTALVVFGFRELRLERIWLEVWTEIPRARHVDPCATSGSPAAPCRRLVDRW